MTTPIKLTRKEASVPWGFRIQGGRDYPGGGGSIVVVKVTAGSIASSCGLSPGDVILKVNGRDSAQLTHKEAQDAIKNSGNQVEFLVSKGSAGTSTWRPGVAPGGGVSLKKNPTVANAYNSPLPLYSEASIAETLSAQSEVLAGGAIGVNFKKNEKQYNYENSEVYKMLQDVEGEYGVSFGVGPGAGVGSGGGAGGVVVDGHHHEKPRPQVQAQQQAQRPQQPHPQQLLKQTTPVTPPQQQQQQQPPQQPQPTYPLPQQQQQPLPPGANICADCERLIVGVFVRIKDKNLHVDCFKCATCGQSLKNVGYYNINNKLYCDIHAKLVAKQQNPGLVAGGFEPTTAPAPFSPGSSGGPAGANVHQQQWAPLTPLTPPTAGATPTGSSSFTQQQQQLQQQQSSSTSSSFYEEKKFEKMTSTSSSSGSKVTWPPLDVPIPMATNTSSTQQQQQQISSQQQQQKFRAAHVPYQPLSNLLVQQQKQQSFNTAPAPFSPKYGSGSGGGNVAYQPLNISAAPAAASFSPQQQVAPAPAPAPMATPPGFSPKMAPPQQVPFKPAPPPKPSGGGFGGAGAGGKSGGGSSLLSSRIGRGILTQPSARVAICGTCNVQIRGPFISTATKLYCPTHFKCSHCTRDLLEVGFVELGGGALACEFCWADKLAPVCRGCGRRVKYECLKAMGGDWHEECFKCGRCGRKLGGGASFFVEDGVAYCEADWNDLFTTKCHSCGFPIEAGDRWVEALGQNYHSQCFNCSACKKNLEGQSFFAKAGRPFCKGHAR